MKKLDLKKNLKDLKGIDLVPNIKMNEVLAEKLSITLSENPTKMYEICKKLSKDGIIELDETDFSGLQNEVKKLKTLSNLALGQILLEFLKAKEIC